MTGVLTAAALTTHVVEASLPPLTPVYGIKLGLSNVFTLFALYALGTASAAAVLILRITLGNLIAGQAVSFIYSLSGGAVSFAVMLLLVRIIPFEQMWVTGGICAVFHNIGQIAAAVVITGTWQIIIYLPLLIAAGIIAGTITGGLAGIVLKKLDKAGFVKIKEYKIFHK